MTEQDRIANANGAASCSAAPTSVRAFEGFFAPKTAANSAEAVSLFKRFQLEPPSWDEFQRKIAQLEKPEADTTNVPRQVKVVYLVRHAEGIHNATANEVGPELWESELAFQEKYLDADLTPFGINDAQSKGPGSVKAELEKGMPPIERVIVSPLSRAIQTAKNFFAKDQAFGLRAEAQVSGRGLFSHQGRQRPATHRETDAEMQARAKEFLLELFREIPEQNVAVVTHSGFMESICAVVLNIRIHPANCEVIPLVLEAL
ncbi:Histidine phosphatase superfamily (branch 1) [Phytophthora infestans]|uniref:Histidine phosphatase superfamily (Branch 1) n=1 Tax=Phytophthora infestans TaxID=4787 RepID=A0A833WXP1_PHYIN|nr:Histidine phosphatase superfamily (branch 1) [Phytophthora infestans]KAI9986214.1 hypothetical protein PInf_025133 [Phytophthora infestans]